MFELFELFDNESWPGSAGPAISTVQVNARTA
jgi:hypothetical protein